MSDWIFAFASATGYSHVADDIPCQDSCLVKQYPGFSLAVVCDGAGSCENSHIGSSKVCELADSYFKSAVEENYWAASDLPEEIKWKEIAANTLEAIKNELFVYSEEQKLPFKSLSCTVIVVIGLEKGILITHIGDGRAGYCNAEGEWFPMMIPYHGNEANETVFITSSIWEESMKSEFIESRVITEEIKAFCLLSDGGEKAAFECNLYDPEKDIYYDPNKPYKDFFHKNITVHLPALKNAGKSQSEINALWKSFLEAGNDKLKNEPDDKTIVLGVKLYTSTDL